MLLAVPVACLVTTVTGAGAGARAATGFKVASTPDASPKEA
jgi:hypothetical protein